MVGERKIELLLSEKNTNSQNLTIQPRPTIQNKTIAFVQKST